ncbi:putative pathway-specific nitrogen regulator protein [Neofusicoccum parvum UCRNP2]|uniref:Putative pathway-specific nitrogen regulator protein n=1 Tax=Botryosphaeria parva (strain UCR-NP2) TaxID=1287680 RepID=R1EMT7_BOTPV|nr:putative pathway-specific nitrogen regulator protein [Neofusicoccum parvum UCRNP2]
MAALDLDNKNLFEVSTDPAVITPFEDVDDPCADFSFDADVPLPSIERDDAATFALDDRPSPSTDEPYTCTARSSPRRLSDHTQLTEPSSISDMPSDTFSLAGHRTKPAVRSPSVSPTKQPNRAAASFRHPSSVRALQLATSASASNSPPSSHQHQKPKRPHPTRSHTTHDHHHRHHRTAAPTLTPTRQPQQQAPLVLLHITLLPPPPPPPFPPHILAATLPRRTHAAYRALAAALADPTLLSRGLLVPHPRDEYEVLEERLLESLGLRPPRVLKCGHFWGAGEDEEEADWGERRDSGCEAVEDEDEEEVCDECSAPLALDDARAGGGRWDVRIYAANGLMRSGAWAAAWSEMERVDVEISPWISPKQWRAMQAAVDEEERERQEAERRDDEERRREVAEAEEAVRAEVEREAGVRAARVAKRAEEEKLRLIGSAALAAAAERKMADERIKDAVKEERRRQREEVAKRRAEMAAARQAARQNIPLGTLLRNSLYVLAADRKNILILLLSTLVAFLSMQSVAPNSQSVELEVLSFDTPAIDNLAIPSAPIEVVYTTSTTIVTRTAFLMETFAPALPVVAADQKDRIFEPVASKSPVAADSSPSSDFLLEADTPVLVVEEEVAIASAQTEASGTSEGEAIMLASPDAADHASTGVDSSPTQDNEHTAEPSLGPETMEPEEEQGSSSSSPATTDQEAAEVMEDVAETSNPAPSPMASEERRESTATDTASMDVPIHLDTDEHMTPVSTVRTPFEVAQYPVCAAQEAEQGLRADESMLDVEEPSVAPEQCSSQPAADYFGQSWICPTADEREDVSMDTDDDDAAEAFMEAVVLEEPKVEGVVTEETKAQIIEDEESDAEKEAQDITVEQVDGTESAEIVVQLPKDVESPVDQPAEETRVDAEEINVVLDVASDV